MFAKGPQPGGKPKADALKLLPEGTTAKAGGRPVCRRGRPAGHPCALPPGHLGPCCVVNQEKPRGRPAGTSAPADEQSKPRSVRLNDARWAKLKHLGRDWLERAIDRAPVTGSETTITPG